ncbi:MAG: sugar-binding domain-containing protein [Melioribacteraceae bacterium]
MNKKIKNNFVFLLLTFQIISCSPNNEKDLINLAGNWNFRVDSNDLGVSEKWYNKILDESVNLPGSMADNGKGYSVDINTKWTGDIIDSSWFISEKYEKYRIPGNIKVPFWLQPEKYYVGAAWYQKEVTIPSDWEGKQIQLFLERCHWESRVWIDSIFIGIQNALATPHVFSLSENLSPGKHLITIRIDNRINDINVGVNSHSISDHTQGNWNGIVGKIELQKKANISIDDFQLYPDIEAKTVKAIIKISNYSVSGKDLKITMQAVPLFTSNIDPPDAKLWELKKTNSLVELEYPMGESPSLWDEFNPNLYKMHLEIQSENGSIDQREVTFGMRKFEVDSTFFKVNNRRIFLRGTLDCAAFPKTGYPPTDISSWSEIFKTIKAHGLNHFRFHSWCPPEAAFQAADILGIYLQVEVSSWANQGTTIGDGKPLDNFIREESERILKFYGNHPSFCLMLYGNEPAGDNQSTILANLIKNWQNKDSRHIYSGGAGWPIIPENEFNNIPSPRIQGWGEGLHSIINGEKPKTDYDWHQKIENFKVPVVSHEIGQWCVYPDFKEMDLYTGNLKPKNFEIFKETLEENGLIEFADSFLLASGKLQALCYKAEIEAALRTPGFAGFHLLGLSDFPGQGTALVGVLNAFWKEKGYISPKEFREFCNQTVPLVRLPKMIYTNDESLEATIEVSHFGEDTLKNISTVWKLSDDNKVYAKGELPVVNIPITNGFKLGEINQKLTQITEPKQLTLSVILGNFKNSWNIWVYPKVNKKIKDADIIVSQKLDNNIIEILNNGGKVLLSPIKGSVKPENGGDIEIGFSSVFWNTAWTKGQAPHTLGILCNPDHPAFKSFPTDYHSNWQWWDAMSHSNAIVYNNVSSQINPIVRVIDDWFKNRPLALLFEVKVGKGKLLVSGIDLVSQNENRPEARQLLYSLKEYMSGDLFKPNIEADVYKLKNFFIN